MWIASLLDLGSAHCGCPGEPIPRECSHSLQGCCLFEEMTGTGDDFKGHGGAHMRHRLPSESQHFHVIAADDQQRGSVHEGEPVPSKIRSSAP